MTSGRRRSWAIDQLAKSGFFHQKLHAWELLEVAQQLDQIKGEQLSWPRGDLAISEAAWDKVIHRGIKPVLVFAHPEILTQVSRSTSYYRMLAMVSQKSFKGRFFARALRPTRPGGDELAALSNGAG